MCFWDQQFAGLFSVLVVYIISASFLSVALNVSLLGWELELMTLNKMRRQWQRNKGVLWKSQMQL